MKRIVLSRSVFGIDFGTGNFKIFDGLSRKTFVEKEIVAVRNKNRLFAVGNEAYEMYEKAPEDVKVIFPIKHGVIADVSCMTMLFVEFYKKMMKQVGTGSRMGRFCIAVPSDVTEVDKRGFYDMIQKSGVKTREIRMVEKPLADAVGLGIDITSTRANMIVDVGADTTEISIIAKAGIVMSHMLSIGGNYLNEIIADGVRKKYNIFIGFQTAEKVKIALADAMFDPDSDIDEDEDVLYIYGRNVITGLPSERAVSKDTVYEIIRPFFDEIVEGINNMLERTPTELITDISNSGIYLTGGSSLIAHFDEYLEKETGYTINTGGNPAESVIRGISRIVSDPEFVKITYNPDQY